MKTKALSLVMAFFMLFAFTTPSVYAYGLKEASASMLLPTTGQAMNDELGSGKTKIMAGVEVAAITTVAILGGLVGGGIVWAGLGPLIANHAWSSVDAYQSAQEKYRTEVLAQQQMADAQRTLETSRQRRFEREETLRSDVRTRMAQAREQVY
ncbi:MAG: hypothetical protein JW893_07750 [Candidatus Omnitrophica bacterium]|nr:hypothetical protein [Candidatus Omnitrophota bacterium]